MPDWLALFPPPWNQSHKALQGFYPYRIRKIYLSDLAPNEGWQEPAHDHRRPSLISGPRSVLNATLSDQNPRGWMNPNETSAGEPIIPDDDEPKAHPSKHGISSKPFRIHSEYFEKHLDAWTIGSYLPEEPSSLVRNSRGHFSTSALSEPLEVGPFMTTALRAAEISQQNSRFSQDEPFISPFVNFSLDLAIGRDLSPVEPISATTKRRPISADSSDHDRLGLVSADSSDGESTAFTFISAKDTQSQDTDNPSAGEESRDQSKGHKTISKTRKANKKAYHQRRRRQKAATTKNTTENVSSDNGTL